jgi:hypothetical protein
MKQFLILGGLLIMLWQGAGAQNIEIISNTNTVYAYEKFELAVRGDFGAPNNYDYSQVSVKGYFKNPAGVIKEADGFYMDDYAYAPDTDSYTPGSGAFKIRFAPDKSGKWAYNVKLFKKNALVYTSPWKSFYAEKSRGKKGFIRISRSDPLFMEFSNKEPFFAIGENLCWWRDKCVPAYTAWMQKLSENGANTIRIWMAPWSFGIEWDGPVGNYGQRQKQAYMLDQVLELAEKYGLYVQLCLVPHGEFSTTANSKWQENPYSLANDGVLNRPEEFFTDPVALKLFQNRLRYIIARWGYSTNIMAWEVFNEADLTDNYDSDNCAAWHKKVLAFIKKYDVNRHLLTTSFSNRFKDPAVWKLEDLDYTQTHIYDLKQEAEKTYEVCESRQDEIKKPHIIGEFGVDTERDAMKKVNDKDGICLHNVLWAGAFTLSFGAPLAWYWDHYVDDNNLYYHFGPLAEFVKDINWSDESLADIKNRQVFYKSAEGRKGGDVEFYPSDDWQKAKKNAFKINNDGSMVNEEYLSAYLFGKNKEDMRNDPVITFQNEQPVQLVIKVDKISDDNELVVSINGTQAFSVSLCAKDFSGKKYFEDWKIYQADLNIEYVIDVPAGNNDIMLENKGNDWIKIERIKVENFLNARLAPVFVSGVQGPQTAYLWLKSNDYGWDIGPGTPKKDAYIDVIDLKPGRYVTDYYETYSGSVLDEHEDIVEKDEPLRVNLPEFTKDIAVKIKKYKK